MAAKKTAYKSAFGRGGSDNLWETVDTIMVDLLHQGGNEGGADADPDSERNNITTRRKEKELDDMMENLDTFLDDLRDISTISNDKTTPPRSINSSAEKIKPKRPTNDEFLHTENPLDSITQGLLYQTSDVPLFASSEVPPPGSELQRSSEMEEYIEEEDSEEEPDDHEWGDENNETRSNEQSESPGDRGSGEIEDLQLPLEQVLLIEKSESQDAPADGGAGGVEAVSTSRLYRAATKAEQIRRLDVKERISKYQELSKITEAQRQQSNKSSTVQPPSVKSFKASGHTSTKSTVHHTVALPNNSYRSRPFSTSSIDRPAPSLLPPRPPNAHPLHIPTTNSSTTKNKLSPSPTSPPDLSVSPTPGATTPTSPSIAPESPRMLLPTPTQGPPRPPRPNAPVQNSSSSWSSSAQPNLALAIDGTQPPPAVPSSRHKKASQRATFAPSTRSSDIARSQINIGARQLRTSAEGIPTASSPSPPSEISILSTSPMFIPTPLDLNDSSSPSESGLQRGANIRRVPSPSLHDPDTNSSLQHISSQESLKHKSHSHLSVSPSPSTSPPTTLSVNKTTKSLRLTPVGQHRTPTRLIFGGDGISVQVPKPNSQPPASSTPTQDNITNSTGNNENENTQGTKNDTTQGITSRHAVPMEVKERNAKIKQLRDLMRRYRTKLLHMDNKHSREVHDLSARINTGAKDAQIHLRSCVSWGQNVLTRACRVSWQWKMFVLQYRYELHTMQMTLLQAKLEVVDQLMTLLEIEHKNPGSAAAKNDFVIYSSFFKDPNEVMTSPEVERMLRIVPKLMRAKRRAKLEFQRLRTVYQPEPPDRRVRRVKDILVRMHPSPLLPNYYAPDDILQADFDSVVTDQRLLEGRHIQHLKNFLEEDLAGDRSITPGEISDFVQHFAQKMTETFGVNAQDASKLLLLSKRAIFPRMYHLLFQAVPASVDEEDKVLAAQLTWIQKLDPIALREGLKLDQRAFKGQNSTAAFEPAIEALNELSFLTVPTDMSVTVHRAFKLTHDITLAQMRSHGGGNAEIGMDDVFPMFLWVVTQCNVARLCLCVYFMEFFSDNEEKISILGYSATSLAAAVAHLSQIEKELFNVVQ